MTNSTSSYEEVYLNNLQSIVENGTKRPSRAGPTRSIFGCSITIDSLRDGLFPILTTRKIHYKPVLGELAAFNNGAETLWQFKQMGCNYWDMNAQAWHKNHGLPLDDIDIRVGRIYGAQWRDFGGVDQLYNLVEGIKSNPFGRRHVVTAWNPAEEEDMCLPPCHIMFQCYVQETGHLDMMVYMRSVDMCLGFPSDVILYATQLLLICQDTKLQPGDLIFVLGDTHVYENHVEQVRDQLQRPMSALPTYALRRGASVDEFHPDDLTLHNYEHAGELKYEFNV